MRSDLLVWIDLEMTGLNPKWDRIIEIATLITDSELDIVAEGPTFAIRQPQELLDGMDAWNSKHHAESGLLDRIRDAGVPEEEAEAETLRFLEEHVERRSAPLCGNSIWQDRRFLGAQMPRVEAYLHYRVIDVSTLKELGRRWHPDILSRAPKKQSTHRALDDIRESIEELRFYRRTLLVPDEGRATEAD